MLIFHIVAIYAAITGINLWKRQLKGNAEYELAKRTVLLLCKYREAFRLFRNPFIYKFEGNETTSANKPSVSECEERCNRLRNVYETRYQRVVDIKPDLDVARLECEVLWDDALSEGFKKIFKLESQVVVAVGDYINQNKLSNDETSRQQNLMYDSYDDKTDEFRKVFNVEFDKIRRYLEPYLKLKSK